MPQTDLALVLTGGGARAAYQVGVLRYIASAYPDFAPGILTGVSAGGIIAIHLAARPGTFAEAADTLVHLWTGLTPDHVFRVDAADLSGRVMRWGLRLLSGGLPGAAHSVGTRSLLDTTPLWDLLRQTLHAGPDGRIPELDRALAAGKLRAIALTASSYTTGQSVTWVQGNDGNGVPTWDRPQRVGVPGTLGIDHVMASAALPFFFPAVQIGKSWYGDGGIRLTAPLSPAVHLGARKIIAVSTRYARSRSEADEPSVPGYPPPAQVAGTLLNAIFLDLLDTDALRLEQINGLVERMPTSSRNGLRRIDFLVMRPSLDLGRLANTMEIDLPRGFRFLVRGLGSREARSNDMLSLLMFQPSYLTRLIELGESDAHARRAEIAAFIEGT